MNDDKYIPYADAGKVIVLFWRNGFAIKSHLNEDHTFNSLSQCKKFCDSQNEWLKREDSDAIL